VTEQNLPDLDYFEPEPGGPTVAVWFQVTVDCDDPHQQAKFWAAALGYRREDPNDFVEAVLAAGWADRDQDTVEIDGRRFFATATGIVHPDDVGAPRGRKRRILFQHVPDRAAGKNKWHLDLNVGPEKRDAEVARLTALGATGQYQVDEPGAQHTTMADPEGNLFCVQ
jgi:catechol 2,3-dioxygenase-like lactoylglutathione lyase family enzyme